MAKKRVLILCTGNAARSQMAEALLRAIAGDGFEVESAGTIATYVRPQAIEAMAEIGIDISHHRSKSQDEFVHENFDHVITVCDDAAANCPVFPGRAKRLHIPVKDPAFAGRNAEERLEAFRRARNELRVRLAEFVARES